MRKLAVKFAVLLLFVLHAGGLVKTVHMFLEHGSTVSGHDCHVCQILASLQSSLPVETPPVICESCWEYVVEFEQQVLSRQPVCRLLNKSPPPAHV